MPIFLFNKLVRDKLREEYEKLGQFARYVVLSEEEHSEALKQKIIEEANEIPVVGRDDIISELADIFQVLDDFAALNGISEAEIQEVKQAKFNKKGGFAQGVFVETLELKNDDEWVKYYRKSPDVFKEIE